MQFMGNKLKEKVRKSIILTLKCNIDYVVKFQTDFRMD